MSSVKVATIALLVGGALGCGWFTWYSKPLTNAANLLLTMLRSVIKRCCSNLSASSSVVAKMTSLN